MAGRTAIGLDIGTSGVRAAEVSLRKGVITLERFGQLALPQGAVRDGEVIDPDVVATTVKALWAHTKFSSKRVILGVANQKVIVREVDLPALPIVELRQSLPFQAQDLIPLPVSEALLDFHPLNEFESAQGDRMVRGLLVAASRDMITDLVGAVQKAGLKPVMVDLTGFALVRSLAQTDALGLGASNEACIDVGAAVTNIVVHQGGAPRFVRMLRMGGQDITNAVVERLGVSQSEAEAIKALSTDPADARSAREALEAAAAAFVEEIRQSLNFYLSSDDATALDRLVLTGGGARLAGLAELVATVTGIPVQRGAPMSSLQMGNTGLSPEQLDFVDPQSAVPVGLAMGAIA